MKRWFVTIPVYASAQVYVRADSKEAAIEKAYEEMSHNLCHHCACDFEIGDPVVDSDVVAEECDE